MVIFLSKKSELQSKSTDFNFIKNFFVFNLEIIEMLTVAEENAYYKVDSGCLIKLEDNSVMACTCNATIPDYATRIAYGVYAEKKVESIVIPDSVKEIDDYAFDNATILSISIPASVESISSNAFEECKGLSTITVDEDNAFYRSDNNCLISKADNVLLVGCKNGNVTIPDYVTKIADYAFSYSEMTSLTIPYGCVEIGYKAFYGCLSLKEVILPNSLVKIGGSAFSYCLALLSVTIPESVTKIYHEAFEPALGTYILYTIYTSYDVKQSEWADNIIGFAGPWAGAVVIYGCDYGYDGDYPYVISWSKHYVSGVSDLQVPTRSGYEFLGWSTQENATEPDSNNYVEIVDGLAYCRFTDDWYDEYFENPYSTEDKWYENKDALPKIYAVWKKID